MISKLNHKIKIQLKSVKRVFFGLVSIVLISAPLGAAKAASISSSDAILSKITASLASNTVSPHSTPQDSGQLQFTDPNPQDLDEFGYSVSVTSDGQTAVVGAPGYTNTDSMTAAGIVYVFTNNGDGTWTNVAQLVPTDASEYAAFGDAVSITPDGSEVAVGAPFVPPGNSDASGIGTAYVFNEPNGGWTGTVGQTTELTGSDISSASVPMTQQFGSSIAVSSDGSFVVVGAKDQNISGVSVNGVGQSGEAYLFVMPGGGWSSESSTHETSTILPSVPLPVGYFGWSIAISGDNSTIAIGAPTGYSSTGQPNPGDPGTGSVYIYTEPQGGWSSEPSSITENTRLYSNDGVNNGYFGSSVSITSNASMIAIGALGQTENSTQYTGATYIFTNNGDGTWSQSNELVASDAAGFDEAGYSVAIAPDGSSVLFGAPDHFSGGIAQSGSSYVFTNNNDGTWTQTNEFNPSNPTAGLSFGWASFYTNNSGDNFTAFIGAPDFAGQSDSSENQQLNSNIVRPRVISPKTTASSNGKVYAYSLTISPVPKPVITSVSKTSVVTNGMFNITGSGLAHALSVKLGTTPLAIVSDSASSITVRAPSFATSGAITVTTIRGSYVSSQSVTIGLAPSISHLSSSSVTPGGTVTISGQNLGNATVTLNGKNLSVDSATTTSIKVTVPIMAITGTLSVSTVFGTATYSSPLTVLSPVVTGLSKTSGKVGTTLIIRGKNLAGVGVVTFYNNVKVAPSKLKVTSTYITVTIPKKAKTGVITLYSAQAPGGVVTKKFTVR